MVADGLCSTCDRWWWICLPPFLPRGGPAITNFEPETFSDVGLTWPGLLLPAWSSCLCLQLAPLPSSTCLTFSQPSTSRDRPYYQTAVQGGYCAADLYLCFKRLCFQTRPLPSDADMVIPRRGGISACPSSMTYSETPSFQAPRPSILHLLRLLPVQDLQSLIVSCSSCPSSSPGQVSR